MATKKQPRKRAKSRKGLSAPKRRRRNSRKRGLSAKGMLADILNPTIAMDSAKKTLASAGGGFGAVIANKVLLPATMGKGVRLLTGLAVGFLGASLGMPAMGAGFTGGMVALAFQNGLMADDAEFTDPNSLADAPLFLDEENNPMVLEEGPDGAQYRYLSEDEIQTLEEAGAFSDYQIIS